MFHVNVGQQMGLMLLSHRNFSFNNRRHGERRAEHLICETRPAFLYNKKFFPREESGTLSLLQMIVKPSPHEADLVWFKSIITG